MERVLFTAKRGGRSGLIPLNQARLLQRAGFGSYEDRSMEGRPQVTKAIPAPQQADDGLGTLDKEALHALAKERGVQVHHAAGADKVRQALRDAAQ